MPLEQDHLKVVAATYTEAEAAVLAGQLEEHGIVAQIVGGFTSGFKAEAPGMVSVVVRSEDTAKAAQILKEARGGMTEQAWSDVDVGESTEEPAGADNGWGRVAWLLLLVPFLGLLLLVFLAIANR